MRERLGRRRCWHMHDARSAAAWTHTRCAPWPYLKPMVFTGLVVGSQGGELHLCCLQGTQLHSNAGTPRGAQHRGRMHTCQAMAQRSRSCYPSMLRQLLTDGTVNAFAMAHLGAGLEKGTRVMCIVACHTALCTRHGHPYRQAHGQKRSLERWQGTTCGSSLSIPDQDGPQMAARGVSPRHKADCTNSLPWQPEALVQGFSCLQGRSWIVAFGTSAGGHQVRCSLTFPATDGTPSLRQNSHASPSPGCCSGTQAPLEIAAGIRQDPKIAWHSHAPFAREVVLEHGNPVQASYARAICSSEEPYCPHQCTRALAPQGTEFPWRLAHVWNRMAANETTMSLRRRC